jgi:hypothetical protein
MTGISPTISAADCWLQVHLCIDTARVLLGQAYRTGVSNRGCRAGSMLRAVDFLLEAAEWRDAARARRRLETRMLPS